MKRIIVCDSGLGGLNIAAHFFEHNTAEKEPCELIYFNAYPEADCGFNKLPSDQAQEELFRNVFEGMKAFSPDLCLIACNTLSIVYERLKKWYTPAFPVAGIVDTAVESMFQALKKDPESSILILGTKSTVESGVYAERLISKGIEKSRIKGLACPGLATLIESDPQSVDVERNIAEYARQAAELFENNNLRLYCALCCTHFGFASEIWKKQFSAFFPNFSGLVDPNDFPGFDFSAETLQYHSRIDFFPGARENMCRWFSKNSPQIADALKNAEHNPELFNL